MQTQIIFEKEKLNIFLFNNQFKNIFGNLIYNSYLKDFDIEIQVHKQHLISILYILKYSSIFLYRLLLDIIPYDKPKQHFRFILFYQLTSDIYPNKIRVVTQTDEYIQSIMQLYPNACWMEREAWDMFGIFFVNNYDLRRILTDYGFEDFPLQKTFRLTGTYEVSYNETVKRVIYQTVSESQKFREFTFLNPWGSFQNRE